MDRKNELPNIEDDEYCWWMDLQPYPGSEPFTENLVVQERNGKYPPRPDTLGTVTWIGKFVPDEAILGDLWRDA